MNEPMGINTIPPLNLPFSHLTLFGPCGMMALVYAC